VSSSIAPSASATSSSAPAAAPAPPLPHRAWRLPGQGALLPIAGTLAIFAVWELVVRLFRIPVYILPAPSAIWVDLAASGPNVLRHSWATLQTVLLGFAVSVAVSLPLASLMALSQTVSRLIYPVLVLTQSVPKVALAPILIIALGAGEMPRVVVTFLVAFFPLVVSVATGMQAVPPELIELGRALDASRWKEVWRIRLPFAVPFVFSGMKIAVALAVVGAVVGEFVAADKGLGYLITTSMAFFKMPLAFGAVILLALMGIVLFQIVVLLERLLFPWSSSSTTVAA
jgi:NitT/TauT family transport system permease protein